MCTQFPNKPGRKPKLLVDWTFLEGVCIFLVPTESHAMMEGSLWRQSHTDKQMQPQIQPSAETGTEIATDTDTKHKTHTKPTHKAHDLDESKG